MEKGKVVFKTNDEGKYFYIVKSGRLELLIENRQTRIFKPWDCFGELALLHKSNRTGTVRCLSDVKLFVLEGKIFQKLIKSINLNKLKEILSFVDMVPIFKCLDNILKTNLARLSKLKEFEDSAEIISKGDLGNRMYVVKSGTVSCRKNPQNEIRLLHAKEFFGHNSLIIESSRTLDVVAVGKVTCFEFSKQTMQEALGENYKEVILFAIFKQCVKADKLFESFFTEEALYEKAFRLFSLKVYKDKEVVYTRAPALQQQSDSKLGIESSVDDFLNLENKNCKIVVLVEGNLVNENTKEIVATGNSVFGGQLINKNFVLKESLIASPDCITLEASWAPLANQLHMTNPIKSLNIHKRISKLRKINLFRNLSEQTFYILSTLMRKEIYKKGDNIFSENTEGEKFYLIHKGKVKISAKNKTLRILEGGSHFGEIALLNAEVRSASVLALEETVCYTLAKPDFLSIIDPEIVERLKDSLYLYDRDIQLKDLFYIKFLGKGKFGNVSLVHNGQNLYAIKAVSRKVVEHKKLLAKYFISEKKTMQILEHPFIIKFVKTLKNENFCFFLLEFINGKNMNEYLTERKCIWNAYETQFYLACLLTVIGYLHKKSIAYRDLKPANMMIDKNGYLKLIDFGTAKVIEDFTQTIIGTPHYIAPEILMGKGYSLSSDYWSLGVCIYEIHYGVYPFGNSANDIIEVYKDILHKDLSFPPDVPKNSDLNFFIKKLLTKRLNNRLCSFSRLKGLPFFAGFVWENLLNFKLNPPFIPEVNNLSQNLANFSQPFELINNMEKNHVKYLTTLDDEEPLQFDKDWADQF